MFNEKGHNILKFDLDDLNRVYYISPPSPVILKRYVLLDFRLYKKTSFLCTDTLILFLLKHNSFKL